MTKDKALELANILIAYSDGKIIQRELNGGKWDDIKDLKGEDLKQAAFLIKREYANLRIKPTPKLVPFTFEDNLVGKVIKTTLSKFIITSQSDEKVGIGHSIKSYKELLYDCTFEDGSKCGKYINE